MPDSTALPSPQARTLLFSALATLVIFALHHVYGALLYATPWRMHAGPIALGVGALSSALFVAYRRRPQARLGRLAGWTLVLLTVTFVVLTTGLFEGLYNHVLKNVLFLGGTSREVLLRLFPPPKYELPNDAGFELSGIAQVVPAALAAVASWRFGRALMGTSTGRRIRPGAVLEARELLTVRESSIRVPDPAGLVHLQFRRFAGCPVCSLHLRSFVVRHEDIAAAGIREVVVFHSSAEELRAHTAMLPFAVIADPGKHLYAELGVESGLRALLDPRAWFPIVRAVTYAAFAIVRGKRRPPAMNPHGGRFGLPADFLIASDGRVLACKYGAFVDDQWSVDELLARAAAASCEPLDLDARSTPRRDEGRRFGIRAG